MGLKYNAATSLEELGSTKSVQSKITILQHLVPPLIVDIELVNISLLCATNLSFRSYTISVLVLGWAVGGIFS